MKTVSHPKSFLLLLLALWVALGAGLRAQDKPVPAPEPPTAAVEPPKPAAPADEAKAAATKTEPATDKVTADEEGKTEPEVAEEAQKPENESAQADGKHSKSHSHGSRRSGNNERVSFGSSSSLAAGEQADAVVSIFGSSTSAGEVSDAVVSVIGSSRVTGGSVGDSVVSILGNTYVNGHVKGEVVTVLGNVEFGPAAVVDGEVVCIGGQITRDASATVRGNVQNIAIAGHHFDFTALTTWFTECLLYARPLAFHGDLIWAWCIAFAFLGFYVLVALLAPAGVVKCVETLEQRPGYSLLSSLLTLLLTPVAFILLALTLFIAIGFVLIPLLSLGLFFAAIFGKIVMLAFIGRRFTKLMGDGPFGHPVFGVLLGGIIVLGLYTIPIVGFITYKLLGILGLGVVVYTLLIQFKASRPPKPASVKPAAAVVASPLGVAEPVDPNAPVPPVFTPGPVSAAPLVISADTLPRAGFWIRLAAATLDAVMVGIAFAMLHSLWSGFGGIFPFWYTVYCVVFWATKGTTIGAIICGLKIVRLDDRPIGWSVALVRVLAGFLSLAVAGLGFIWVAFDDEKQSWHDKIAGTTIVKVPKGTALL